MKRSSLVLLTAAAIYLVACADSSPPKPEIQRRHDYQVAVYSDGKEIKDFNQSLIHRMDITPKVVAAMSASGSTLPFDGKPEKDARGNVTGVRVANARGTNLALLGLRDKDLVTAVGNSRARSIGDLKKVFIELKTQKSASLTIERSGKPHKMFYYLGKG